MRIEVPKGKLPARRDPGDASFSIPLQTITPILGGAPKTRDVDRVDVIRVPSIRGQLRFWWRALYAHEFAEPSDLFAAEKAVWGGVSGEHRSSTKVTRSPVEFWITGTRAGEAQIDTDDIQLYGRGETPGAYALWPAKSQRGRQGNPEVPTAHRYRAGVSFTLHVQADRLRAASAQVLRDIDPVVSVRNAITAWVLFGGVGGRTRRGLGSLTVDSSHANEWLPAELTRQALAQVFGHDPLDGKSSIARDTSFLANAAIHAGSVQADAIRAWTTALHWARDFRQKVGSGDGFARESGSGNTPGQSRWPESDKVRLLLKPGGGWTHRPRHKGPPVWPRASFGLPIVGQFKDRDDGPNFTIIWQPKGAQGVDRLASPLILKPMALRGGKFVPVALWLTRAMPSGLVGLSNGQKGERLALRPNSGAPFDEVAAKDDEILYRPLANVVDRPSGERVKTAFLNWVESQGVKRIS